MFKKVFKPFWSYDIKKTEKWLSSMALRGYHFTKINMNTRYFIFEEGEPQTIRYRIGYDKMREDSLPLALLNNGWKMLFRHRNWYVIANEKPIDQIKTFPMHEDLIKRNQTLIYIFGGLTLYKVVSSLIMLAIFHSLFPDVSVEVVKSRLWNVKPFELVIWAFIIYTFIRLYITNQRLIRENGNKTTLNKTIPIATSLSKAEEKQLKRIGKIIVKRKLAWMYSPDKLEKWLEEMEEQGYNLYRISEIGIAFFFTKGSPRRVRYCVDFQNVATQSYFDMHTEAGWKLIYTSFTSFTKWMIWSREYAKCEERPQLYSDIFYLLKHARQVVVTHSCIFIPFIVAYGFIIKLHLNNVLKYAVEFDWTIFFMLGGIIILFGSYIVKILLYYRRLKQQTYY